MIIPQVIKEKCTIITIFFVLSKQRNNPSVILQDPVIV